MASNPHMPCQMWNTGRDRRVRLAPALTHQALLPPLDPSQHPSRLAMLCECLSVPCRCGMLAAESTARVQCRRYKPCIVLLTTV